MSVLACKLFGLWCATYSFLPQTIQSSPNMSSTITSCTCQDNGITWPCRLPSSDSGFLCYMSDKPKSE